MTQFENKEVAKPQSDWDGNIISHSVAASQTGKIFATSWHMKKEAYGESTINAVRKRLLYLTKSCLLEQPESLEAL